MTKIDYLTHAGVPHVVNHSTWEAYLKQYAFELLVAQARRGVNVLVDYAPMLEELDVDVVVSIRDRETGYRFELPRAREQGNDGRPTQSLPKGEG